MLGCSLAALLQSCELQQPRRGVMITCSTGSAGRLKLKLGHRAAYWLMLNKSKLLVKRPIIRKDPCELECTIQTQTRVTSYLYFTQFLADSEHSPKIKKPGYKPCCSAIHVLIVKIKKSQLCKKAGLKHCNSVILLDQEQPVLPAERAYSAVWAAGVCSGVSA